MLKKLKIVSLTAVATLAVSAVAASAASAADEFTAASYPVTVQGEQDGTHTFTYEGRTVTCNNATFQSEAQEGPSASLTITPSYTNCHAVILGNTLPATVTMGSCDYLFAADPPDVDLQCASGDVQIHVYNSSSHTAENEVCTYTISEEPELGGISYTNNANGTVTVGANVPVPTQRVKGGGLTCGPTSGTSIYAGDTIVEGVSGEEVVAIDVAEVE